jgi:hypothetical protein
MAISRLTSDEVSREEALAKVEEAKWEIRYRERLLVLAPDIGNPPNKEKVAVLLFKLVKLPPSEFRQMSAKSRLEFVELAIEASKKQSCRPRKNSPRVTVNSLMLDELRRNPESKTWTSRQWAERLNCGRTAIQKCAAWKMCVASREENKNVAKQRAKKQYED